MSPLTTAGIVAGSKSKTFSTSRYLLLMHRSENGINTRFRESRSTKPPPAEEAILAPADLLSFCRFFRAQIFFCVSCLQLTAQHTLFAVGPIESFWTVAGVRHCVDAWCGTRAAVPTGVGSTRCWDSAKEQVSVFGKQTSRPVPTLKVLDLVQSTSLVLPEAILVLVEQSIDGRLALGQDVRGAGGAGFAAALDALSQMLQVPATKGPHSFSKISCDSLLVRKEAPSLVNKVLSLKTLETFRKFRARDTDRLVNHTGPKKKEYCHSLAHLRVRNVSGVGTFPFWFRHSIFLALVLKHAFVAANQFQESVHRVPVQSVRSGPPGLGRHDRNWYWRSGRVHVQWTLTVWTVVLPSHVWTFFFVHPSLLKFHPDLLNKFILCPENLEEE